MKLAALNARFILCTHSPKSDSQLREGCYGKYITMNCQTGSIYRGSKTDSGRYNRNTSLSKTEDTICVIILKLF